MNPVYIVDSIRTPRARANQKGGLNKLNPYELLNFLYKDIESKNFFNFPLRSDFYLPFLVWFVCKIGIFLLECF